MFRKSWIGSERRDRAVAASSLKSTSSFREELSVEQAKLSRIQTESKKLRDKLCNHDLAAKRLPTFEFPIEYRDGTKASFELVLDQWVTYAEWRFKMFLYEEGKRGLAYVEGMGKFNVDEHRHPFSERYFVRRGLLFDKVTAPGSTGSSSSRLEAGHYLEIPAHHWHSPVVASEFCELYLEWEM